MAGTPIKERIRTAAAATSSLTALLGTSPFRWYDDRLNQGSAMPAVVVIQISGAPVYVATGRLNTHWVRMQFTIWAADSSTCWNVEQTLLPFLDTLDLLGRPGLVQRPNGVVLQREGMQTQIQPPLFWRIVDCEMFTSDAL